jgi:ATP-dependent RNA helicase DeaD
MSEQTDLSTLSIKDLRVLAGEHHINNRSRLGKEDLIQALQGVLQGRLASVSEKPTSDKTGDKASKDSAKAAKLEKAEKADKPEKIEKTIPANEPEVLDAAAVAELTVQESPAAAAPAASETPATSETPDPNERHRRRRRRRRGRGRGRRDEYASSANGQPVNDDETDDDGDDEDASEANAEETAKETPSAKPIASTAPTVNTASNARTSSGPAPELAKSEATKPSAPISVTPATSATGSAPAVATPAAPARPAVAQTSAKPATPGVNPAVVRTGSPAPQSPARPPQHAGQTTQPAPMANAGDPRPPRPRIDGQLRPLPSVLDRLCSFSKGVLELCDPTTPSWAQARLSELLAEIGVVPMPVSGVPHPDYHQVVGTVVAAHIPHGQIALIEAPGFAMRGDRGDLFSLRKAIVRISGAERSDQVPQKAVIAPRPAPVAQAAPAAPVASVAPTVPAASPSPAAEKPVAEKPVAEKSLVEKPAAPIQPAQNNNAPRLAAKPDAGRQTNRTHGMEPVGEAPGLPLAAQTPEQLASRPKAAGFATLGLNDQILADLAAIGFNEPTPIQAASIPVVLSGKDVLGQAQTGTGKTAAFVLPVLQKLYSVSSPERKPVALLLCPTRELARQMYNEFIRMAGASGARAVVIYGGTPMDDQIRALERFPHVIIGTPGRIIDHVKRKALDLSGLHMLTLDEADQMLDIGFWPDVNYIISHTPPTRQVLLFSATFPDQVRELAAKHMKEPQEVRIAPKVVTVEQVDQKYIAVARERKNNLLAHFIETQNPPQLVVFCRTKHQTDRVAEVLKRKKMSAGAIHGDLPQSKREKILAQFRSGEIQSLIATNVAARGLDIPTVSHVVNYDIPEMPEEYVHRIGRTARNGAKGVARTFITPEDGQFLLEIEKHIGLLLEEEKIDGFEATPAEPEVKRTIADMPVGQPRLLKPIVGGIRLGRRRR